VTDVGSFQLTEVWRSYTILSSEGVQRGGSVTGVDTLQSRHQLRAVAMYFAPRLLGEFVRLFVALVYVVALFLLYPYVDEHNYAKQKHPKYNEFRSGIRLHSL
jgi:hypothetical protein